MSNLIMLVGLAATAFVAAVASLQPLAASNRSFDPAASHLDDRSGDGVACSLLSAKSCPSRVVVVLELELDLDLLDLCSFSPNNRLQR